MNNSIKILSSFIIGAAAGAATGLLLAPNKGKDTRKKIKKETNKLIKDLEQTASDQVDKIKSTYNESVEKAAKTGKSAIENIKHTVSAN